MYTRYKQTEELEKLQNIIKRQKKEINKKQEQEKIRADAQKQMEEEEERIYKEEQKAAKKQRENEKFNAEMQKKNATKLNLSAHDRKKLKKVRFYINYTV